MNRYDLIPKRFVHVRECFVSKYASIIDDDINPSISVNSRLHNSVTIFCRCLVAHSFSTILLDLLDHIVWIDKIIDNDRSAVSSK